MQAARPRLQITPLQISLGIQLHHHFASKFLIDTLHNLGFCSLYSEILRFESSAAASQGIDIPGIEKGQVLQFVADNVDHNVATLDGKGTFHGMGIIAASTPGKKLNKAVKRICVSPEEITDLANISISFFKQSQPPPSINFQKIHQMSISDPTQYLDMATKIIWPLRCPTNPTCLNMNLQRTPRLCLITIVFHDKKTTPSLQMPFGN